MRAPSIVAACAAALVLAATGLAATRTAAKQASACPASWRAGWQQLADRIGAPVYCPSWMPNPLDAQIKGQWEDGYAITRAHSYFLSFLSHDQGDVHVIFRGYPGHTTIPTCATVTLNGSKTLRGKTPCFADPNGTVTVGPIRATLYTVNQDADEWHLLYAWRHQGSLYTVSEHVIKPFTYVQVKRNLIHILRSIVLLRPASR
jgi:hypothetical protein